MQTHILRTLVRRSIPQLTLLATLASLALSCGVDVLGDDPPQGTIYEPVGLALHPSGRYLYVVNSNFDLAYRRDRGGRVVVVDLSSQSVILGAGVQIGTFGGQIALNTPDDGSPTRAYIPVRGDNSLIALDIDEDGSTLRCNGSTLGSSCALPTSSEDPFGVAVRTLTFGATSVDFVAVTHLLGNEVTGFAIRGDDIDSFNRVTAPLVAGANAIARSPRTNQFYVTGRFENALYAFRPVFSRSGEVEGLFETAEIQVEHAAPYGGIDSRGIAFNQAGTMAYVANRAPNTLLFVDTGPTDPVRNTGTRNQVVDEITMPNSPASVHTVMREDGSEMIYVSLSGEDEILVIDPKTRAIVDSITLPSPAFEMVYDGVKKRLYTTLFVEDAIGVIDLDPASASFHQLLAVIQ